jgi:hypothetical protein
MIGFSDHPLALYVFSHDGEYKKIGVPFYPLSSFAECLTEDCIVSLQQYAEWCGDRQRGGSSLCWYATELPCPINRAFMYFVQRMACLLVVLDLVDVRSSYLDIVFPHNLIERSDGFHTGKYSFDMFTHLRASLDSPGWY